VPLCVEGVKPRGNGERMAVRSREVAVLDGVLQTIRFYSEAISTTRRQARPRLKAWEQDGDAMFRIKRKGWPATSKDEKNEGDTRVRKT
jgi:hypothetical protein